MKLFLGGSKTLYTCAKACLYSSYSIQSFRLGMQNDAGSVAGTFPVFNKRRILMKGVHSDTSSLSKLIPKHVATRGILKKEIFSKNQDFLSIRGEGEPIHGRKENKGSLLAFAKNRRPKAVDDEKVSFRKLSGKQVFQERDRVTSREHGSTEKSVIEVSSSHRREVLHVQAPNAMRNMKKDCKKQSNWKNEMRMQENSIHIGDTNCLGTNVFSDGEFQADSNIQSASRGHFNNGSRSGRFITYKLGYENSERKTSINKETKKREKNKLKVTDLSLAPVRGEPHSEYIIRRKSVMNEAQNALMDEVEDYSNIGDDWIMKRIGWLCKEVPVLKASGIVKILNKQRKWIKQEHAIEIIDHLIRLVELNRAHGVLKWMQQQPFYKFDYDLHNNMAYILGRNNKVSRCQDVFDEIVRNGKFPDRSVFIALMKAYLHESDKKYVDNAWKLYTQMQQLGFDVSPNLSETLMKRLACPTGRWLQQAESLLENMKDSGYPISEGIYTCLLEIYGKRGDHQKIDALITDISDENIGKDVNILNAVLAACAKDGNVKKAEQTWEEIIELGLKPNWRTYAHLIQVYGKTNIPKAWKIFEKMKAENIAANIVTYQAIIDVMAKDGTHIDRVLQLLKEIEESGLKPLQPAFNAVMSMYLDLKMYKEVEDIFERGKAAKARPSHDAFNMLISSYIDRGQLENAESVFQEMKRTDGMGPNSRTFNLLLKGYGIGCFRGRVKEIFEEMTSRGCQVDSDVKSHIQSMVGVKKLEELEKQRLRLTDEQREIIPGLLLGGAMIQSPEGNHNYELRLEFDLTNPISKTVRDHIVFLFQSWWKNKEEIFFSSEDEQIHSVLGSTSPVAQLETVSHSSLKFYANQYRPNGIPAIPRLIHRWLRPRTLAYWYMYGGHKCPTTGGIVLNARNYNAKQIQLVVKTLKARTIDCKRKKRKDGDVIRFEGRSSIWLWKLMEPHVLDNIRDKLKPKELSANLYNAETDDVSEIGDIGSSDEDDWEDLETAKSEEATIA